MTAEGLVEDYDDHVFGDVFPSVSSRHAVMELTRRWRHGLKLIF